MPWNTIGHEWAVNLLARAAATQPSHAYLFTGPAQIGKLTLALDFARALNCVGPGERPCGQCRSCQAIAAGRHPDVSLVRRLPDKSEIAVKQLRDVQNELNLRPYEGRWRVAIIENMHEANLNAANAFLKTLEEPAPQVVLLLTANTPEALLLTVRSRCQSVPMRPLPITQVEEVLRERFGADSERAAMAARLSGGRLGWAMEAIQDEERLAARRELLQTLLDSVPQGRSAQIELAGRLTRGDRDVRGVLDLWLSWWRDLLLVKGQCAGAIVNLDERERLLRDAGHLELRAIGRYLTIIEDARQQIEQNVNAQLALEVVLINAPV
ncbi:MAG: DNA polymerase III subunit delta' [Chloroflexi bacterium]|nr:DNA polymerase III subunit delta' [Chloroflexota bacterium]